MLPPLMTLLFLSCLWLVGSLALPFLLDNFERIAAALNGDGGTAFPQR